MRLPTSDLRISTARPLLSPAILEEDLPLLEAGATLVQAGRRAVGDILFGRDDRLLAIVGPCSIHDPAAALDYAKKLKHSYITGAALYRLLTAQPEAMP